MANDARYMQRAIELAALGRGKTSPNPQVGAVIVHQGRIIGEGYHHRSGQPHAEVMAVRSVSPQDRVLLPQSTIYVTLEPCSHFGKTPPCADLIIHERIPHVIVATLDPFPEVAGRGIQRLRDAGIQVEVGLLGEEARQLNSAFITAHTLHRPWVTLKWAQSLDGFIDRLRTSADAPPTLFSNPFQQRHIHALRQRHDAILVGYRTALLDNPQLTNRTWYGKSPLRVVLDPQLALPHTLHLFSDQLAPTLVLHSAESRPAQSLEASTEGVRYRFLPPEKFTPQGILAALTEVGVQSVLIEGGAATLREFLSAGLADEIWVETAPIVLGTGVASPGIPPLV